MIPAYYIGWVGLDSRSPAAIVSGLDSTPGIPIVYIDNQHKVVVEINSADSIRLHNTAAAPQSGSITLMW